MENKKQDLFIEQTAKYYCIDIEIVKTYYYKYYNKDMNTFYNKLEECLKQIPLFK